MSLFSLAFKNPASLMRRIVLLAEGEVLVSAKKYSILSFSVALMIGLLTGSSWSFFLTLAWFFGFDFAATKILGLSTVKLDSLSESRLRQLIKGSLLTCLVSFPIAMFCNVGIWVLFCAGYMGYFFHSAFKFAASESEKEWANLCSRSWKTSLGFALFSFFFLTSLFPASPQVVKLDQTQYAEAGYNSEDENSENKAENKPKEEEQNAFAWEGHAALAQAQYAGNANILGHHNYYFTND